MSQKAELHVKKIDTPACEWFIFNLTDVNLLCTEVVQASVIVSLTKAVHKLML